MHLLPTLFLLSLLSGQLLRIPLPFGITAYPHDIILGVYVLLWFLWKRAKEEKIILPPLIKPILIFIGALLISYLVNIPGHTMAECLIGISYTVRIGLYLGLYVIISNTKNPAFWATRLYGVGVMFAILGIVQYVLYPDLRNLEYLGWDPHYYRLFSTFLDPNFAGLFLILTFLLGTAFIFKRLENVKNLFGQAIVLTALLLTLSRSSYVAFIVSIVGFMWMKKSWKALIGIAVFTIVIFFAPLPQKSVTPLFRSETAKARVENWAYGIKLFKQKPLFGLGFNFLRVIQEPDDRTKDTLQFSHASGGIDNSFLYVFVTAGMVGGICFIHLLVSLGKIGRNLVVSKNGRKLGLIYLLSLIAICSHSMFVNSFFYPWIFIWLWILTGIVDQKTKNSAI